MALQLPLPKDFERQSDFYHQMGQLISAGMPISQSLEMSGRSLPARWHPAIRKALFGVESGSRFHEALRSTPQFLAEFDLALLQAGEASGRLDQSLRLLSNFYAEKAKLTRRVISGLAYPVLLLHLALFLLNLPFLFLTGDGAGFAARIALVLLPLYVLALLLIWLAQGRHGESFRAAVEAITHQLPVLGPARKALAMARFCASLEALINAGVGVVEAWEMAGEASGSPALAQTIRTWRPRLAGGLTPSELIAESRVFPQLFAQLYSTAEVSGTQDEALKRLYAYYQEEASRRMLHLARWLPFLFYLALLLALAWKVVTFWTGHYSGLLNDAL